MKSATKGVCYHHRDKVWRAAITVRGHTRELGRFKTEEEAVAARRAAEKRKADKRPSEEHRLSVENKKLRAALDVLLEVNAGLRLTIKQLEA